ncbi:MAG: hypothetical protein EBY78_05735 [Actinobacteria bacterium]|nr:hypothetical protein [Actinomycetota bacterium]
MKLKRSNDRKVANAVSPNGKTPTIANTFGLPAGKDFSCPNQTPTCSKVCYAGKLEKIYKGVRDTLLHNWNLLKDADHDTMEKLISDMIDEFRADCDKRNAPKLFRIHWDGDFFNDTYTFAWKHVILNNPMKEMIGRVGAKCPENKKAIPLIDKEGSACVKCSLCVYNKADIVFSAKKR